MYLDNIEGHNSSKFIPDEIHLLDLKICNTLHVNVCTITNNMFNVKPYKCICAAILHKTWYVTDV